MKLNKILLLFCLGLGWAQTAGAVCFFQSIQTAAFGAYDPLAGAHLDSTFTIRIRCVPVAVAVVSISTGGSGTYATRQMSHNITPGIDKLNYNLYVDAARTQIFGDGVTGGTFTYTHPATGGVKTSTVYTRAFMDQWPATGFYQDNLTVTITY